MEFRAPTASAEQNKTAVNYLTKHLRDSSQGREVATKILAELGGAVEGYPDWHPLLTAPPRKESDTHVQSLSQLKTYRGIDHTVECVRGFVTCPYGEETALKLVDAVNQVPVLHAYKLEEKLYSDSAFPVVVAATNIVLEADGTIRSRDAITWFTEITVQAARNAEVAETWWNLRSCILGSPHGARSSLFVNQFAGVHMRKILEALNNSGMFGPIKESSLAMLSEKKRASIGNTLVRTAATNWKKHEEEFEFELRGETCKARVSDTWNDGKELSISVEIGNFDLYVSGFYYPEDEKTTHSEPKGKRALAEKFL